MVGVLIEGFSVDELLAWPVERLRELVACGRPIVFGAGTATLLAEVQLQEGRLTIDLAHVDGGGEGVLPTLWRFGEHYARAERVREIEWIVHATRCAKPNPRLPGVLRRMGFAIEDRPPRGEVYRRLDVLFDG